MFGIVATCYSGTGMATLDAFNDAGTMGAFGFLGCVHPHLHRCAALSEEDRASLRPRRDGALHRSRWPCS